MITVTINQGEQYRSVWNMPVRIDNRDTWKVIKDLRIVSVIIMTTKYKVYLPYTEDLKHHLCKCFKKKIKLKIQKKERTQLKCY